MTTLERAFELADAGSCRTVSDIRRQLTKERHDQVDAHLASGALKKQLLARIAAAAAR
ncbi:hypothetical protein [Sphingomonas rubra]|uniref:Uncharacterized protein n=1 Tax=Sphingomonas rubra TaxID=634430 RepID=A0A1I5REC6_9SPHN|nr:hypothetical protein [Sphingomonas rubra]SFP56879.1 hypothetical protein SAMN04488241_103203 [Sphingomonas rubra]